ncbi:M48 family metallopeptidase [Thiorhodospira sibirica]|uniref:M48 family metallopeptidase n=1 Tax=Thiorhodospira sibirica TaxID=154347 RepID=UPI00022C1108|nr:M48 family metallopeptidase [Thiorhodospira sibirica]
MSDQARRAVLVWGWRSLAIGLGGGMLGGCKTLEIGANLGQSLGLLDAQQAQSLVRTGTAVGRAMEQIDPEQEYYIGRSVGATLLSQYPVYQNPALHSYLNLLGSYVSLASQTPQTFGGYRFLVLDSEEINAFAAPGGLIMVTRGMLRCCTSEDELAAVLAHEVSHIQQRHAVQAISQARIVAAMQAITVEGIRHYARGTDLTMLVEALEGSIGDIMNTMVQRGYARTQEQEADRIAVGILQRTGYDDQALPTMLEQMQQRLQPGGLDFARTHPAPSQRIEGIQPLLASVRTAIPKSRTQRFQQALRGV